MEVGQPSGTATTGYDRRGAGGGFFSAAAGETLVGSEGMAFHHQGTALVGAEASDGHRALFGHGDNAVPMVALTTDGPKFLHSAIGPRLAMVTDAQGEVLEHYQDTAYGGWSTLSELGYPTPASVIGVSTPMGQPIQRAAGLSRFGMRWYRPNLLRWMTPDPIGVAGGGNMYAYVGKISRPTLRR